MGCPAFQVSTVGHDLRARSRPSCSFACMGAVFALGLRSRGAPCSRYLPDSLISCNDQLAGAHRGLLEVLRVRRQDLPASHLLPQNPDRAHAGNPPQTLVVFLGRGEPYSVVCCPVVLVTEDEDNLLLNVDRQAANMDASRRERRDRVEHELMRDSFARLSRETGCPPGKGNFIATSFRHG